MGTATTGLDSKKSILSSVIKKYIMGLTGLVWAGFVFGHMAGNMLLFISPDMYNSYGHAITSGAFIYVVEAVLILSLLAHVFLAICLTRENRSSKGIAYAAKPKTSKKTTLASQTMIIQGSIILVFIILHIITFKYGTYYETTVNGVQMRDLYRLIVEVFHQPLYVIWYVVALLVLLLHLKHGFGSIFQSFGIVEHSHRKLVHQASLAYAVVVAGGFIAQPIYVWTMVN